MMKLVRGRMWLLALGLATMVALVYRPVLAADYIWDDDVYVGENANLQHWRGLGQIWFSPRSSPQYYPLVFSSFWLERQLFGPSPTSHHVVNVSLHVANALLLWALLRRLNVRAAYFIAIVFAVHPVHLESVAWITERKNVLSTLFFLAALGAYLHFALASDEAAKRPAPNPWRWYVASFVLFLCALLSKTVTATFPAVALAILWWKKDEITAGDVLRLAPFVVAGLLFGAATAWIEVHHVGALGQDWTLGPIERVLLAGRVPWFYAFKIVWPHPLMFIYPRWEVSAADPWQYVYPAATLAGVALLYVVRRRIGTAPLVAVSVFLLSLFPAMGFFNVYPMRFSYVADHFQYLPSIGVIALVAAAGHWLLQRGGVGVMRVPLAILVVCALAWTARAETGKYRGIEALWTDTIVKNPDAWIAQNNLGNLRLQQGRRHEAVACFEQALRVKPDLAVAHNNLGIALYSEGDVGGAERQYRAAVQLDPGYAEAWNNLGISLASAGRYPDALTAYRAALAIDPKYAMARYNMGNVFVREGDLDAANVHYRAAIGMNPDLAMAHYNLGLNLLSQGQSAEAAAHLDRAFELKPDFAQGYFEVGNVLLRKGRAAEAVRSYTAAISVQAGYADAYCNRGTARLQLGDMEQAIADYREALRLRPAYPAAAAGLAHALGRR